eukprot:TRINITY_DN5384_c0_g1_i3.p1 TRINITY_DN5384_c0_g1~~TRINITY_DN5384_c0_g1_i3.p1  ORF type:complete len:330 (-),score=50.64 TRINITY_DN5384_c0_g1_i3:10-999(-)
MSKVKIARPPPPWKKTDQEIKAAVGDVSSMSLALQRLFVPSADLFPPLPSPKRGDWLSEHKEIGQPFRTFHRVALRAIPHATYRTIYIQPLGDFSSPRTPDLNIIVKFAQAFFYDLDVVLLPCVSLTDPSLPRLTHRINPDTGKRQFLTGDILSWLSSTKTANKKRARTEIVSIVVTMEDVYPDEAWNFVFGLAQLSDGLGVWSFARFDPLFFEPDSPAHHLPPSQQHHKLILARSLKVLAHEVTHMFGLHHCVYYHCLMNGANHQQEQDESPFHLCPVCLRKLHDSLKSDFVQRYEVLCQFYEEYGMEPERQFIRACLADIHEEKKEE